MTMSGRAIYPKKATRPIRTVIVKCPPSILANKRIIKANVLIKTLKNSNRPIKIFAGHGNPGGKKLFKKLNSPFL